MVIDYDVAALAYHSLKWNIIIDSVSFFRFFSADLKGWTAICQSNTVLDNMLTD